MSTLQLNFLGQFRVMRDGRPVNRFESDKGRALLAYLAVESAVPHARSVLTTLLWPDYTETSARANLRQALYQLRQVLGDEDDASPLLLVTRQTLQWNHTAAYSLDVATVTSLTQRCANHAHAALAQCPTCLQDLRQAIDLYQGEFLAGFTIADSTPFEEWRRSKQEEFHLQALDALSLLADMAEAQGALDEALRHARRQLGLEPWREDAHRQIMRLLTRQGQRAAAVAQYQLCRQVLMEELGVEPSAATTALYAQIRAGTLPDTVIDSASSPNTLASPQPVSLAPLHDWGEMPAVDFFAGRSQEVRQLQTWLTPVPSSNEPPAQLISLLGLGGIGKTTLAAMVTKAIAPAYDVVIWRSLLNAPPLTELLENWLQLLSRQRLLTMPASLDEQLRLLLTYLRQARCLLVLDNVESILAAGDASTQAGATRPGYAGYDQLFQQIGGGDHTSCLLLTSREQPYALLRLVRQAQPTSGRVRVMALAGLDLAASQLVIQKSGLAAPTPEVARLVNDYSGNPLALQLVAATINDFFAGDITTFLQAEGLFFAGIRVVLDQQFARLSAVEHEILIWLAIEREAISVATLRSNLLQDQRHGATSSSEVLEALHALQQRSLIEKSDAGLTLQNVIIEYTTHYLVEQLYREIAEFGGWFLAEQAANRQSPATPLESVPQPYTLAFFNRFALLKACAKQYVRQSQMRLILQPLVERLVTKFGAAQLTTVLQAILVRLQQQPVPQPGYAAGNLLNLFLHLGCDLRGYNFARLAVWQAYLCEATLYDVNFAGADLTGSNFTKPFNFIWSVAYSPDGQYLAGGSLEGAVFLWQASDGQAIQLYQGHTALVYALAFSPDGKWLASGSEDKTICVWDRQRGQLRYRLDDHTGFVNSVAFSPDSTLLAGASDDRTVCVWNVASRQLVQRLRGHSARVNSVAFHPNGLLLASGSDDGTVQLWDVIAGKSIRSWTVAEAIFTVTFHPSGAFLVCSGKDAILHCWDIETGAQRSALHGHEAEVWSVAISRDGGLLASSGADETLRLWDVQSGDCVRMIHAHQRCVTAVAFSPDRKTIASTSHDCTVCVWDVQSGRLLHILTGYSVAVSALAFQPAGDLLAATLGNEQVRIWDARTGYPRHLLHGYSKETNAIAFHPQLPIFLSGCDDSDVRVWDLQSGKQRWLCQGHSRDVLAVAISHNGRSVASSASDEPVRIWEIPAANASSAVLSTGSTVASAPLQQLIASPAQRIFALAFSPDDTLLAGGSDVGLHLWCAQSGEIVQTFPEQTLNNVALAFSPDGSLLASGNFDHVVCLWSVATGELRSALRNHHGTIYALAFSPDGNLLVSASGDHRLSLWDVQAGKLLHTYIGHQNRVFCVAFHLDGQQIASGSFDGVVKCWDVQSGACLETFYAKGPHAGMNISGITGISEAQRVALKTLGAIDLAAQIS